MFTDFHAMLQQESAVLKTKYSNSNILPTFCMTSIQNAAVCQRMLNDQQTIRPQKNLLTNLATIEPFELLLRRHSMSPQGFVSEGSTPVDCAPICLLCERVRAKYAVLVVVLYCKMQSQADAGTGLI